MKIRIGDTVEYFSKRAGENPTGVVGVVTGFYDRDSAFVVCPTGHRWLLQLKALKKKR
tara:strand:- start:244 stop:417 length:174 start_codon:yes stop_codon:yes gene_type:complete